VGIAARQIHEHLRAIGPWVDWDGSTCDGFKYGDPDREVTGIAVGWQSLQSALEEAHRKGCNLFVTHEPTFYSHMDDDEVLKTSPPAEKKRRFLDRTGMIVYRCHDLWDVYPRQGILDAWADFLGLSEPAVKSRYCSIHPVPTTTAWELALRIACRVKPLGQQSVQFIGTKWRMVSRLAIGTGAITPVREMIEMGADVVLATDDGTSMWRDGSYAADLGVPIILVNHTTAEIPGVRQLAAYLAEQFAPMPVEFVGPTCGYQIYASETERITRLRMRHDDLNHLPPLEVPDGYVCRPMAADEPWAYVQVMNRSNFTGGCDQAWFERTFSSDPEYDPSYLQIIWKGDEPVAAAAAWHYELEGERWGMIHWVGSSDRERGKGLGVTVTLAALHRLRQRGFARAVLNTHGWRMPAVATYLRLGFSPWPTNETPQETWDQVLSELESWRKSALNRDRESMPSCV